MIDMLLPPAVRESDFLAVDTVDEVEISRRSSRLVRDLHRFLNQVSCLHDLQQVRRGWVSRVMYREPFGTFATEAYGWYTYHHGGRNEAQFNIGLSRDYLRVGLGFEFSMRKGGDPTIVGLAYSCFTNVIRRNLDEFDRFVRNNVLEVEWRPADNTVAYVPTEQVARWLPDPPQQFGWIFVGRLLRRTQGRDILEDPIRLGRVIESVFGGFRPIWEETQRMAARLK